MSTPTAQPADAARVAQVRISDDESLILSFLGDLTPVEVVAAFLRDLGDLLPEIGEPLYDVAEQLDPEAPEYPLPCPPPEPEPVYPIGGFCGPESYR